MTFRIHSTLNVCNTDSNWKCCNKNKSHLNIADYNSCLLYYVFGRENFLRRISLWQKLGFDWLDTVGKNAYESEQTLNCVNQKYIQNKSNGNSDKDKSHGIFKNVYWILSVQLFSVKQVVFKVSYHFIVLFIIGKISAPPILFNGQNKETW